MNETFRKQLQAMSWLGVAVLALAVAWLGQAVSSHAGGPGETITVSGTGKVVAKPDVAVAELAITTQGGTAQSAQDSANKKSVAVVKYLKDAGIEDRDIKTSSYNIYPQQDYSNGRGTIVGYQVTQSMTVKIRDLDKANKILDGVVGAGVNQVNNFRFDIDEPEALKADARQEAIDDANKKAEELEDQLGVRLGKIVSFSENTGIYPGPIYLKDMASNGGMGGGPSAPDLPVGENEVSLTVTITYQLK